MRSDLELLREYARNKSEESFTALVNRHLNLVYSAALRQVRSPELAEEVAQSAFLDLARQAQALAPNTILTAWLYQVTRRTAINVVRGEARRQLREQAAYQITSMNAANSDWTHIEALLDEAMCALDETDRVAVLLRYFDNKSLREVGLMLGTSDNAAQKRISRAVEHLREFFAGRGIAIGAAALVVALSANAVQAVPAGLAAVVAAACALPGASLAGGATASVTKLIAMTAMQKALIAGTIVAVTGTGIFEARKASTLKTQVQNLQQQQAPLTEQIQQLQGEHDEATRQIAALRAENKRLDRNTSELLKLRGEVGMLRQNQAARPQPALSPSYETGAAASQGSSPEEFGKELGLAVVRGDAGALDKLSELAAGELANFKATNSAALDDTQRGDLARQTFAPLRAAFDVISEAVAGSNQVAIDAVVKAMQMPSLKDSTIQCIGAMAGSGNDAALETLLNPRKYDFLPSTAVPALQPAAEHGNPRAVAALAAVANDTNQQAFWYMAGRGLEKSAESGNDVAVNALISLAASTNDSVRRAIIPGLRAAASNQNPKAAEALRSMGVE